jgi:hypothetical protein
MVYTYAACLIVILIGKVSLKGQCHEIFLIGDVHSRFHTSFCLTFIVGSLSKVPSILRIFRFSEENGTNDKKVNFALTFCVPSFH